MLIMLSAFNKCIYPVRYLCIRHSEKKYYDWIFPLVIALAVFSVLHFLDAPFLGNDGIIRAVNELLQILVGFYIASLAAVASFQSEILDLGFNGAPVTIRIKEDGQRRNQHLTRRKFLCHLFGYLAAGSLAIYWAGVVMTWVYPAILVKLGSTNYFNSLLVVIELIYLLFASQLLCVTTLGLYYLVHRMHERAPKEQD